MTRFKRTLISALWIGGILGASSPLFAQKGRAAATMPVREATPSQNISHGLDFQTALDTGPIWTRLRGPRFYISSTTNTPRRDDHLVAYEVVNGKLPKKTSLSISLAGQPDQALAVELGTSAFVLLPAKRVTNGPPPEVPKDLAMFVVYEGAVEGHPEVSHVGLPAGLQHHDETVPAVNESRLLLIQSLEEGSSDDDSADQATVIDHFGLNALDLGDRVKIAAEATLR